MGYTISQMAEMFEVTEHTLRYYTDLGLLPCERDCCNHRVFTEESVNWLRAIKCLRVCGFSMEQILQYCQLCRQEENGDNLRARYQIVLEAREDAYKRLEEAKTTVSYMEHKVRHYEDILAGRGADDSNPARWTAGAASCCHTSKEEPDE